MYHLVAATKQRSLLANMNSIQVKTKELLRFHSGCNGKHVTIATRYVAETYHPKKPPHQI